MPDPDLNPTTSPDAQEGLSHRYGNDALILLPLASGNLAIFSRDFQLHSILYDAPTLADLRRLSRECHTKMMAKARLNAENTFYGEPTDRLLAKNLRDARASETKQRTTKTNIEAMEL